MDSIESQAQPEGRTRRMSRRAVLGSFVGIAAAGTIAPLIQRLEQVAPVPAASKTKRRWAMVIDLRRCDGCGKCSEACQTTHYLNPDQTWLKVYKRHDATGAEYFMPRPCMQCEDAPCLQVCPVGATFRTDDDVVLVDPNRCIGCRLCMGACPYEARSFNWTEPKVKPPLPTKPTPEFPAPQIVGTVGKCTFCVHETRKGNLPSCVDACSMEAIYMGDLDADIATNGRTTVRLSTFIRDNHAVRAKEELNTRPRVYYILGHGQDLMF